MIISRTCEACNTERYIEVDTNALKEWRENGMHVQKAFPNVSADDRELFFISSICGNCWEELFPEDD